MSADVVVAYAALIVLLVLSVIGGAIQSRYLRRKADERRLQDQNPDDPGIF